MKPTVPASDDDVQNFKNRQNGEEKVLLSNKYVKSDYYDVLLESQKQQKKNTNFSSYLIKIYVRMFVFEKKKCKKKNLQTCGFRLQHYDDFFSFSPFPLDGKLYFIGELQIAFYHFVSLTQGRNIWVLNEDQKKKSTYLLYSFAAQFMPL